MIAEQLADTRGAETIGDTYFGLYLLAMGRGRPRNPAEIGVLLSRSGFGEPREIPVPLPLQGRILVARPIGSR